MDAERGGAPSDPLFPDLTREQRYLAYARQCRDEMITRFERVDSESAADEITKEYVEVTVAEALEDLRSPGAGDFFGRIDDEGGDRWYVGRRHIESDGHDPVVVDWRAPIAAPFYRATVADPLGLSFRRRFTVAERELVAYLDEHLDDPGAADIATGIPDPVLAEIGAARTGTMRDIVATIQAEQDVVIRSPLAGALVVQGGPGTGKTAVGLHRAAYLLFEHRRRLSREGILVVGPNRVFLDYIASVLPSLGERSVQQRTLLELCVPRIDITGRDTPADAKAKGGAAMLEELEAAAAAKIRPPEQPVRVPLGVRTLVIEPQEIAEWLRLAWDGNLPVNRRREAVNAIARRELLRRTGLDDAWSRAEPLRRALAAAWPRLQPRPLVLDVLRRAGLAPTSRHRWTPADQILVDEAHSLLDGPPFVFGHVVVDEAQDQSAVGLRAIGRRSPSGSFTILGDLAQSTTPAGQEEWRDVRRHLGAASSRTAELTVGYRVPAPILDIANRLLPHTGVSVSASRSVRAVGERPTLHVVDETDLMAAVADTVRAVRHRHHLTAVVTPERHRAPIVSALDAIGFEAVGHMQPLGPAQVPVFSPEEVKGLEFDGVVVVNPAEIFDGTARGARLLYVALTRAVQQVALVGTAPLDLLTAP